MSPSQKAEIVELVEENSKAVTLAIGDGGNGWFEDSYVH